MAGVREWAWSVFALARVTAFHVVFDVLVHVWPPKPWFDALGCCEYLEMSAGWMVVGHVEHWFNLGFVEHDSWFLGCLVLELVILEQVGFSYAGGIFLQATYQIQVLCFIQLLGRWSGQKVRWIGFSCLILDPERVLLEVSYPLAELAICEPLLV